MQAVNFCVYEAFCLWEPENLDPDLWCFCLVSRSQPSILCDCLVPTSIRGSNRHVEAIETSLTEWDYAWMLTARNCNCNRNSASSSSNAITILLKDPFFAHNATLNRHFIFSHQSFNNLNTCLCRSCDGIMSNLKTVLIFNAEIESY